MKRKIKSVIANLGWSVQFDIAIIQMKFERLIKKIKWQHSKKKHHVKCNEICLFCPYINICMGDEKMKF